MAAHGCSGVYNSAGTGKRQLRREISAARLLRKLAGMSKQIVQKAREAGSATTVVTRWCWCTVRVASVNMQN